MIKNTWSELEFTYYGADDDVEITVTVFYEYEAGSKERRYGHPDDWHDSEGPEIHLHGAKWADGWILTEAQFSALVQAHKHSIFEEIEEQEDNHADIN